jgi:hypothetical protein
MPPVILRVACNGGIQGKEANPYIPETQMRLPIPSGPHTTRASRWYTCMLAIPRTLPRGGFAGDMACGAGQDSPALSGDHRQRNHRRQS